MLSLLRYVASVVGGWMDTEHWWNDNDNGKLWNSILVLLRSCLQTCMTYTIAECTVNKLLMMDRGTVWNT